MVSDLFSCINERWGEEMTLKGKKIAVYVTGGIASYKVASFVRLLVKAKAEVRVAMTAAATNFISPLTMATLSKNPVLTKFSDAEQRGNFIPHIEIARWADLSIVIPATADIIGKMANGIADDLVSSALIATVKNKFVVPAMNDEMWANPAVQRNVHQLKADGIHIMEPATGFLAEGYAGKGRMPEPQAVLEWIEKQANDQPLRGIKVLVTAGGTQEPIDPVRFIGNRSSGKMGIALAENAALQGADVTLIAGMVTVDLPTNVNVIRIQTFANLQTKLMEEFPQNDVLIMAAAVSDYHVERPDDQKIKANANQQVQLTLKRNPNLLRILGNQKHRQVLVGFAAETDHLLQNATAELEDKKVDMIVANDVSRSDIGFGSDQNAGYILQPHQEPLEVSKVSKQVFAQKILNEIEKLIRKEEG